MAIPVDVVAPAPPVLATTPMRSPPRPPSKATPLATLSIHPLAATALAVTAMLFGLVLRLPWEPAVSFGLKQNKNHATCDVCAPSEITRLHTRSDVYYPCSGLRCHAWLYLPKPGASVSSHTLSNAVQTAAHTLLHPAFTASAARAGINAYVHVPEGVNVHIVRENAAGEEGAAVPLVEAPAADHSTHGVGGGAADLVIKHEKKFKKSWFGHGKGEAPAGPPVIVMASGMGGTKDHKLDQFAETFADAGYAVFLFDYRFWGGSDGEPRHFLCPMAQVQDYTSVVKYIQETKGIEGAVDPSRIVLWGTSWSGGHSLTTASQLGDDITAVITMEPFLSSKVLNSRRSRTQILCHPLRTLRFLLVGISDALRAFLHLPRAYVRFVAEEGYEGLSMGRLTKADYAVYEGSIPKNRLGGNHNWGLVSLRVWDFLTYNPSANLHKIKVPVLLVSGIEDDITTDESIQAAAQQLANATYVPLSGTHITLYTNPQLLPVMLAYLSEVVPAVEH